MTARPLYNPAEPRPALVRRIMAKHGLPEPTARLLALLVQGGAANG